MKPVLAIAAGWLVWAAGFSAIYGLHGLGCGIGAEQRALGPVTLHQAMLVGTWLVTIAIAVAALLLRRGTVGTTLDRIVTASWIAALAAILVTGAPVLLPSRCV